MRRIAIVIGTAAVLATLQGTIAEAQPQRVRTIVVTPRSYLDPGNVVPVGSLSQYALAGQLYTSPPPTLQSQPELDVLPPRIGAGENPFPPIDFGWRLPGR